MLILYKPPFKKFVKKQTRSFQLVIEDEVETVIRNPLTGEGKKGDLTGFRIHKFFYQGQKFLLSYAIQTGEIVFFTVGSHENFYRELKKYVKEVD
jgi:ParE-like toxin of type II bacterial toxin-antitoxin system